jgi:hypothetical protein
MLLLLSLALLPLPLHRQRDAGAVPTPKARGRGGKTRGGVSRGRASAKRRTGVRNARAPQKEAEEEHAEEHEAEHAEEHVEESQEVCLRALCASRILLILLFLRMELARTTRGILLEKMSLRSRLMNRSKVCISKFLGSFSHHVRPLTQSTRVQSTT